MSRSIESFTPARRHGSFRAWLWTLTINKIRDAARRDANHPAATGGSTAAMALRSTPDHNAEPIDGSSPDHAGVSPMQDLVRRAMDQVRADFSARTWRMFERSVVGGQTSTAIAEELNVTPAAVRQARSRVLRRIRQQLGDVA